MLHRIRVWLAVLVILIGLLLLFNNLGIIAFSWSSIISCLICAFGIRLIVGWFHQESGWRLFWGLVLFLGGLSLFLCPRIWPVYGFEELWPLGLIIFGVAWWFDFIREPSRLWQLVKAFAATAFGLLLLLSKIGVLGSETEGFYRVLYPVVILLIGFAILFRRRPKFPQITQVRWEIKDGPPRGDA